MWVDKIVLAESENPFFQPYIKYNSGLHKNRALSLIFDR